MTKRQKLMSPARPHQQQQRLNSHLVCFVSIELVKS